MPPGLHAHPDRLRWNERYADTPPTFEPHPLASAAMAAGLPDGPVLELACGRSGSALLLAEAGRQITAVDVSDLALTQLAAEARRRGLADRIECMEADISSRDHGQQRYALVLATHYWDPAAFAAACRAVMPAGLLGWEALAADPEGEGPAQPWRVAHRELSARLPGRFTVLEEQLVVSGGKRSTRLLARAAPATRV
jgi:SAM-dependent methyltransferase